MIHAPASPDEAENTDPSAEPAHGNECTSGVHRVSRPKSAPPRTGWTVLEEFEQDGYLYQVTRRANALGEARLTQRERQVLAFASAGHSNKSIAVELGVAPSTVGVLLFRAAAKLGVRSRSRLLAAYAELEAKGER